MKFAVIDNNQDPMQPQEGRGAGFAQALAAWEYGVDYDFIRYDRIGENLDSLRHCHGLLLSGSRFDFALPDDRLDLETCRKMVPEFLLLQEFRAPVLGICFGHQLLAIAEEFVMDRQEFGSLRIHNMKIPEDGHRVMPLQLNAPLRFTDQRELWVQHNHKQEVTLNDSLLRYFEVIAGSDLSPVGIMQHRSREWFGVQFHPEIGRESKRGDITRHKDAERDGYKLLQSFVRYCLR